MSIRNVVICVLCLGRHFFWDYFLWFAIFKAIHVISPGHIRSTLCWDYLQMSLHLSCDLRDLMILVSERCSDCLLDFTSQNLMFMLFWFSVQCLFPALSLSFFIHFLFSPSRLPSRGTWVSSSAKKLHGNVFTQDTILTAVILESCILGHPVYPNHIMLLRIIKTTMWCYLW